MEWVELVEQGANIITGWRYEDILNSYKQLKHTTKDVFLLLCTGMDGMFILSGNFNE